MGSTVFVQVIIKMKTFLLISLTFAATQNVQSDALAPLNSAQIDVSEYRVFETATVVADPKNTIPSGDGVHSLGLYKYSLNGTLAVQSTQSTQPLDDASSLFLVEHVPTGQRGLTSGVVIVKHQPTASPQAIAADYGFSVTDELPSINRFAIKLDSVPDFPTVRDALLNDVRVLLVELDVSYAPIAVQ